MTTTEFSNEFDLLWDNLRYNSSGYASLNEYEKSVFLTQAQEELIKNYFNPKGNKYHEGFGDSAKRDIDFSGLVETINTDSFFTQSEKLDSRIINFSIGENVFFILNENIKYTLNGATINATIKSLSPIEYDRLASKVYFEPPKKTAWRLIGETMGSGEASVSILPHTGASDYIYTLRYVHRPDPIILEDLGDYSINGISTVSECELDPIIHREILVRAITLATNSLSGNLNSDLQLEQRAE